MALFPVPVIKRIKSIIRADHFLFLSNGIKQDIQFVEIYNEMIHQYYDDAGIIIKKDYEINDGCAQQFTIVKAFFSLMERPLKPVQMIFESMHDKGLSDGIRGYVKNALTCAVTVDS